MNKTLAEKLQTIAENVPKVYNAGYEKGKAEGGGTGGGSDKQAWRLNSNSIDVSANYSWEIPFTTLGDVMGDSEFVKLEIANNADINYITANGTPQTMYSSTWVNGGCWGPPDYNIVAFTTALPESLTNWLKNNGQQIV